MDVSVIIASGRPDITKCLECLAKQDGGVKYELIVVAEAGARRPEDNVIWITVDTPNPAVKRNIGSRAAKGRYLAFIDDDAFAPPDWLLKISRALDTDPSIAGIGGPNLPPEDASEAERLTDAVLSSRLGSGSNSYAGGGEEREAEVGDIHLTNFAARREFFVEMGGFNETLGYGAEDSEFIYVAKRLQRARFVYSPDIIVMHRRRGWGRALLSQRFRLRMQNGRLLWVRPGMYMKRPMFIAGLAGALFLPPAILMAPLLGAVMGSAYLVALAYASSKIKYNSRFRWVLATAAVHAISVAGILAGLLRIPSRREYAGLARRS